jgi:hypothetical protein
MNMRGCVYERRLRRNLFGTGFALALAATLLYRCGGGTDLAGGTDFPNTRVSVSGHAYTPAGSPLVNASVSLHKAVAVSVDSADMVGSTRSGTSGYWEFRQVPVGDYRVLTVSADSSMVSVDTLVSIEDTLTAVSLTDTVRAAGSVAGRISLPLSSSAAAWCRLKDEPFGCRIDGQGRFRLNAVEPGPHLLLIVVADSGGPAIVAADSIHPEAGQVALLDSLVRLPFMNGVNNALFDDFEDSTMWQGNGYVWWQYSDSLAGGKSRATIDFGEKPGAGDSGRCAHLGLSLDSATSWGFVGLGTHLGDPWLGAYKAYEFTALKSISFKMRGTPHRVDCITFSSIYGNYITLATIDSMSDSWTGYTIDIDSAVALLDQEQKSWWDRSAAFTTVIEFQISRPNALSPWNGDMRIDDVVLTFK